MRSRDEVLREFGVPVMSKLLPSHADRYDAMADRIRELEAQQAASEPVAATDAMVEAAAKVGSDNGFDRLYDVPSMYWDAMYKVVTAALTRPTTPTRGSDE